ncbi:MAG: CvpA family protein [Oscillospiraceae bacterium]|nr:CvpA family protein [Oscillospiraceae bacterium]
MHIFLDLILLAILGFCAWQGYKRGIIGGILAVIFLIVAIYGGNLVASTYSNMFTDMFNPFVSGYLQSAESQAIDEVVPRELQHLSTEDLFRLEQGLEPIVIRQVISDLGIHHSRADTFTDRYLELRDDGRSVNSSLTEVLVYAFCFYIVYTIGFLLILIALTVVYNIIPVSLRLPGLKLVDEIGGGVLGFVQGILLVFMLTWFLGYVGILLPEGLLTRTWITELFVGANPMVGYINM